MLTPRPQDTLHKYWLMRLLTAICEDSDLSRKLGFKGGTCAAMRGFLNRFSIDLDFDLLVEKKEISAVTKNLETLFKKLELTIKDHISKIPQYFLKYPTRDTDARNTLKLDSSFPIPKANRYEVVRLPDIDRLVQCQTLETMVANKLVALKNRHDQGGKVAGRDLFDVHYFLMQGYPYNPAIIFELTQTPIPTFFAKLIDFVDKKFNDTVIDQDLNTLLPNKEFHSIRKALKRETLQLLKDELKRAEMSYEKDIL